VMLSLVILLISSFFNGFLVNIIQIKAIILSFQNKAVTNTQLRCAS
jgi:hypothetical protein